VDPAHFSVLHYSVGAGVATVTLNAPERRNAWGGAMAIEYRWALHHAHHDPDVRVVVLTGHGADFCVGADTRTLDRIDTEGGAYERARATLPPYPDGTPDGLRHNHCFPLTIAKPVIAAVEGACAGVGFVVASYADLRWVAAGAKVTSSFASLGLPAECGLAWLLARQVGLPNAMQLLWSAAVLDGHEAARLGWAQHVTPPGEARDAATSYAHTIARESSALSLATMKRAVVIDAAGDLGTAYERSVADMETALRHPDLRRGLRARAAWSRPDFLARPERAVGDHHGEP
jgi:enoyl-CoA hydratase/carnithine racemase